MAVGARFAQQTRVGSDEAVLLEVDGGRAGVDRARALASLAETARRVSPLTLAVDRRLGVLPALEPVLPEGLQRGSTIGVSGPGASSLALALVAGATSGGGWAATVGCDDLCLAAAEGIGVPLHRLVTVERPTRALWSTVVAVLLDAFEIVLVAPATRVGAGDARRLRSRARERGSVLIDLAGTWPEAHDVSLRVVRAEWHGLGHGHGVLESRLVEIEVGGRRGATRPRAVSLWLPGPDGAPAATFGAVVTGHVTGHAGADIDALVDVDTSDGDEHAVGAPGRSLPLRSVG